MVSMTTRTERLDEAIDEVIQAAWRDGIAYAEGKDADGSMDTAKTALRTAIYALMQIGVPDGCVVVKREDLRTVLIDDPFALTDAWIPATDRLMAAVSDA